MAASFEGIFKTASKQVLGPEAKPPERILVLDVGGTHVKMLCTGEKEPSKFASGPLMTPEELVKGVKAATKDWHYDVISIGYPGAALHGKPVAEPHSLGRGWVGFDFKSAFECPISLINDAAMQAMGGYEGGKMLFLGLGTGLGSTMIANGFVEPMELGHLPYREKTYEDYLGKRGYKRFGKKDWRKAVNKIIGELFQALEPDYIIIGGGNVKKLKDLPENCRLGNNADAFTGGYKLWTHQGGDESQ